MNAMFEPVRATVRRYGEDRRCYNRPWLPGARYVSHPPRDVDRTLRRRWRFFFDHAGGIVGERAVTAMALARAEMHAEAADWYVLWEPDECPDLSWLGPGEEVGEVLCAVLVRMPQSASDGNLSTVLASLCGIVDPDASYRRVVEAELALEAMEREGIA